MITQAKEALLNVRPRPVSGHYSKFSRAMALHLQLNSVLRGTTSPEVAVKTLKSELQQIIEHKANKPANQGPTHLITPAPCS